MLIVALVLAVIGLAALVTAVVTSNELIAWVCIAASVIGVLLLIVDALRERSRGDAADEVRAQATRPKPSPTSTRSIPEEEAGRPKTPMKHRGPNRSAATTRSPARTATTAEPRCAKLFDGVAVSVVGVASSSRTSSSVTWWKSANTCPTASNPAASSRTPRRRPPRRVGGRPTPARPAPRPRSAPDWRPGPRARRRACWRRWRSRRRRGSPSCLPDPRAGGRRDRPARDG